MLRAASIVALLFAITVGSVFGQSYYSPEPTDSAQFTALVLGKPVRIPADSGGGLIAVGKMAPLSFKFHPVKGTTYLWGFFRVPSQSENWRSEEFYIIAEEKSLKVLAIFSCGRGAQELFSNNRMAIAGPAGEQIWNEPGSAPAKSSLLATPCDGLFCVTQDRDSYYLMRVAPEFTRLKDFPLLVVGTFSFEIDARAYADLHTAPVTVLPPFKVESFDSPQMLAAIQGRPFPIPDSMGGGFAEIGKPAPNTLKLTRVEGTPWCRGTVTMPPLDEVRPGGGFDFFAKEPDGPIEIISAVGFPALLLFESDRTAPPETEAVGLATESSPNKADQRYTLLATRFPNLIVAKGENFEGFYRLSPGVRLVDALPIGGDYRIKLDANRAAPKWIAEQEPLLTRAWSAPLSPDWATIEKIEQEALVIVGDKTKATKLITTPGAKLWASLTGANTESKGPGRSLLKRFGEAALKEPYELSAFREIYEFSLLYPDTRPAAPLTEKLLEKYDAMSVEKLLNRDYSGATEAPALTSLRHARRIDSAEATQDDINSFRFYIVHVMPSEEADAIIPPNEKIWTRQLAASPDNALWSRIARIALKSFPEKENEVKWRIDVLTAPKKSALRTTVAKLLAPLSDEELAATENNELESQPGMALATFIHTSEKTGFTFQSMCFKMTELLTGIRHRSIYEPFQDALASVLKPEILHQVITYSIERKEHLRLRESFARRLRELEQEHAKRGNLALAATFAVNQAQSRGLAAPTDRVSFLQLPTDASSDNPWDRARFYVGKLARASYPPLEADLAETKELHRLLEGSYELAVNPAHTLLGITSGTLSEFTLAKNKDPQTKLLRLSRSPLGFMPADRTASSPWNGHEHPLLATRWSDLKGAQKDVDSIGKTDTWAAHFYGTDSSEQELRDVRTRLAAARGNAQGYQSNVSSAANGLSNYEREKAALERDGIVVGRDPNRPDRVVTRELNSFENRSIANTIDNQKEALRRESAHQNYLNSEVASLEARERELMSQISEYRGKATNSSPDYINSSRRQLRDMQAYYDEAWAKIGTRPDNGAGFIRDPIRIQALAHYRNGLWKQLPDASKEDQPELFWRRWWLSEYRTDATYNFGDANFPHEAPRIDVLEAVWHHQLEQAFLADDNEATAQLFVDGLRALARIVDAKPALRAELAAAWSRIGSKAPYVHSAILGVAGRHYDASARLLLEPLY